MQTASSLRPVPRHRIGIVPVCFAALATLAIGSNRVVAGPVQRPVYELVGASTPSPHPVVTAPATAITVQDMIDEAARRFGVPASWIAEVMTVESRGRAGALSPKGAIGLMQVMPETYAGLRLRYGLGVNPWDPRDNILAGAAYLRELYDRYGAPGFLVAYNAGPGRWDDYRLHARPLPAETIAYIGRLGPVVGGSVLPIPTFATAPAIRAPVVPPIFVALSTDPARLQAVAERARIARIVEANASVVGRSDAIFVTRTRVPEPSPSGASGADLTEIPAPSRSTPAGEASPMTLPPTPLFPARSSTAASR